LSVDGANRSPGLAVPGRVLQEIIDRALAEDLGERGDITTRLVVEPSKLGVAVVTAGDDGVVAGLEAAERTFTTVDGDLVVRCRLRDGEPVRRGDGVMEVEGRVASILTAERPALNFLMRLSGIATMTRALVRETGDSGTVILDTRKTTPGLRILEKAAVRAGGGMNHRFGLYDMVLIKDNHLAAAGGVEEAVRRAREGLSRLGLDLEIEVEVENLRELRRAILAGADRVLLDNVSPALVRRAVAVRDELAERTGRRVPLEVSGGVTRNWVGKLAQQGLDFISSGALTHSAPSLNFSLGLVRVEDP